MIGSLVKLENSYRSAQLVFFFVTRRNGPANWRGAWIENGQAQIGTRNDGSLFCAPKANRCARATFFEIACLQFSRNSKSRRRASIASGVSVNPFYTSPTLTLSRWIIGWGMRTATGERAMRSGSSKMLLGVGCGPGRSVSDPSSWPTFRTRQIGQRKRR